MNIQQLDNHFEFNKIFSSYKDENGKISWMKIAEFDNLPETFIDKYFLKLKSYMIESKQKLSDFIILKYKTKLNWFIILKTYHLSEEVLTNSVDIFNANNLWHLVLANQNISYSFALANLASIRKLDKNYIRKIISNNNFSPNVRRLLKSI